MVCFLYQYDRIFFITGVPVGRTDPALLGEGGIFSLLSMEGMETQQIKHNMALSPAVARVARIVLQSRLCFFPGSTWSGFSDPARQKGAVSCLAHLGATAATCEGL